MTNGVLTLAAFLLGRREAIERCAATPGLWRVGFLLTITAAIARSYDGAYFPAQPWRLIIPALASLVTAGLIYPALLLASKGKGIRWPADAEIIPFDRWLALVWLTAPLAWLYAVPYERWLDVYDAALANVITLAVVSAWRVWLMIRCLSVLHGCSAAAASGIVLPVASAVACAALLVSASAGWPSPIVIMGGLRLEPGYARNQQISSHSCAISGFALLAFSIYYGLACFRREQWRSFESVASAAPPVRLLPSAVAALILGLAACALFQPEQAVRHRVDALLQQGYRNALDHPFEVLHNADYRADAFEPYMSALAEAYPNSPPRGWAPLVPTLTMSDPPIDLVASMSRWASIPESPGWLREKLQANLLAMWREESGLDLYLVAYLVAAIDAIPPDAPLPEESLRREICESLSKLAARSYDRETAAIARLRARLCESIAK